MKKFILTFVVYQFALQLSGQNWSRTGARWDFVFYAPSSHHAIFASHYALSSDTLISGQMCQIIASDTGNLYSYESGDTVYLLANGRFRPMLYFGAHVGDTLSFYSYPRYVRARLDSVNKVQLSGSDSIRVFHIHHVESSFLGTYTTSYAERLGADNSLFPYFDINCYGFQNLCNYGDSTIAGFYIHQGVDCDVHLGEEQLENPEVSIQVYPSPSSGSFSIRIKGFDPDVRAVRIYDMAGRSVRSQYTVNKLIEDSLPAGLYLIEVKQGAKTAYARLTIE